MKKLLLAVLVTLSALPLSLANAAVPTTPITPKVIGMSAPVDTWSARVAEVGAAGLRSRRIFATLSSDGRNQSKIIGQTVAAGMIPVISYKVPSFTTLNQGGYDKWLTATRNYLSSLGVQVTATYWHEPHGDMTPAEFRTGSARFLSLVKAPNVAVGPILNGWLLDRQVSTFASYTSPALLAGWDFVGVDSYQAGTASSPSTTLLPARAVPQTAAWLDTQGFGDKPIVLGEYNGFTGAAMQQAGEWILSTPELWIANVWNTDHTTFSVLTGDRLAAYRATKADARAMR